VIFNKKTDVGLLQFANDTLFVSKASTEHM